MHFSKITKKQTLILVFLLAMTLSGVLHGVNMLGYPYYESDEGTYTSQAWSLLNDGELAPYTYWYDHPPGGWILIALWTSLLGGDFFMFGTSIDTARIFMFVIQLLSTALVFFITYKITKNPVAPFLAVVLFSVSPLVIYFHRRVLLDNIMTLWLLASTAPLYVKHLKMRNYMASGLFYAFAVLTKITAVVFGPALLFLVFIRGSDVSKVFRTVTWLTVSILTVSIYILYALLRNEFFPAGIFDSSEHVSLISTILFQISRGSDVPFWNHSSDFFVAVRDWLNKDYVYVYLIYILGVIGLMTSYYKKNLRFLAFAVLLFVVFLIRGGLVINFYIMPMIPFVSILIAGAIFEIGKDIDKYFSRNYLATGLLLVTIFGIGAHYTFFGTHHHFSKDETSQQRSALEWIKTNLDEDNSIIIDSYAYVELHDPRYINQKIFRNADWYYKISQDPAIRDGKYNNYWRNFQYVALTHEMLKQINKPEHPLVREVYDNSLPVGKWIGDDVTYIDEQNFETTNGDWAMIFEVNGTSREQLSDSWSFYKDRYIKSYGQNVDPANGETTSEGQSYAMLRAVWMNDKDAFKGIWLWTRDHLQHRVQDNLLSWRWKGDRLIDGNNATDADQDIAAALLMAHKLWGVDEYLEEAQIIIDAIWENTVVKINGRYYLLSMNTEQADRYFGYLYNPSYISPMWYRIFAEVDSDPEHEWEKLAADSYRTLNDLSARSGNTTGLPPDWILIQKGTGKPIEADLYINNVSRNHGFDAFRTLWRVSLDYEWFNSSDAEIYLSRVNRYLLPYYKANGDLPTVISPSGEALSWQGSIANDAGYLAALMRTEDPQTGIKFHDKFITSKLASDGTYWGSGWNYYDANWAWFGTALFNHNLPNLWNFEIQY